MSILAQLNQDLADVTASAQAALVTIHNARGHGAGTIWQSDGLIITNAHVVARARQPLVTLPDGDKLPARILATSEERDLAILTVDAHDLPTVPIGDSRRLSPGDWVLAVGHPWGVRNAATHGVVVSIDDPLPEIRTVHDDWLAMSLHLRPGHSGGAVVNAEGELVGINTLMAGPDVGIAVPSHVAAAFLRDVIGAERRARTTV
ncbi:MAG: trypsin-like peptidase domain-containing protein [Chloroflexota bacterium]